MPHPTCRRIAVPAMVSVVALLALSGPLDGQGQEGFRIRSGVELINVTATVTDGSGRFVPGLKQSDFLVFEDDQPVEITHFNAERVPVSLGIVLDTSGSMVGSKIAAARAALERLLFDLLGPDDEVFLYTFDHKPRLLGGWTIDRARVREELRRIRPDGATALYDAVAEALPLLRSGRHRKKALLIISDGNDTSSRMDLQALKRLIRESEALVYAIGMEAHTTPLGDSIPRGANISLQRRRPIPIPFPLPGRGSPPRNPPIPGVPPGTGAPRPPSLPVPDEPRSAPTMTGSESVNASALHGIADDSGGRTEIIRDARDLNPATGRIADELSKQYYLGYPSRGYRDGRWHAIRVEVREKSLRVRARRGYIATDQGHGQH
jgi:Ca-activated chloride channel family protein